MRLFRPLRGEQRRNQGKDRRSRGNGREDHRQQTRVVHLLDEELDHSGPRGQKSKLIIFFITRTPIVIQIALRASMIRPVGVVQSSEM